MSQLNDMRANKAFSDSDSSVDEKCVIASERQSGFWHKQEIVIG